jgi:carbamoyltransferase
MNSVRSITVLGIHDGHTAGAAIVRDGRVLAAISEERLTNVKNFSGVPRLAIPEVIRLAGIPPEQIDLIALGCLVRATAPVKDEQTWRMLLYKRMAPLFQSHAASDLLVRGFHRVRRMGDLRAILLQLGLERKEIHFIDHHTSHAACAFYQRPWEEDTLVLTLDGAGDNLSATVSAGRGRRMERIASTTFYHSPGNNLYSEITGYLGLKRWEHEYKVMGMAPYGQPEACLEGMRKIVRIHPRRPLEFQNTLGAYSTELQGKLRKLLAGQRFDNIAAACQKHYEDLVTQWVRNAVRETDLHRIACAGGMFLNVKANKLIREMPEVEEAFFYPAADDSGTPVGAALEVYYRYCEREKLDPHKSPLSDLYTGREFSDDAIERVLIEAGWKGRAEYVREPEAAVADLLAHGKVVARFSGREEWGPRALGNRSILADPRDLRVIRKINFAIKHRDFWMPFAPSILEEDAGSYLLEPRSAPFMIEAFDSTEKADEIIAGLHPFDRTARPQTVGSSNPSYRKLIQLFKDRTGVGGVLNTSFNLHGFPVVGSPQSALWTLENSELDGLVMGGWLVRRSA